MGYVIGLDIGSQSAKGVLTDPDGKIVAKAQVPYSPYYPRQTWAEQDTRQYIEAVITITKRLLTESHINPSMIGTIGIDAINDGLVPVDRCGRALRNGILWMDRRANDEIKEFNSRFDPSELYRITGLNPDASHTAAKALWIKKKERRIFDQAKYLLNIASFIVFWLTGEPVLDYAQASSSMLLDVRSGKWDTSLCDAFGIDPSLLGSLCDSISTAGTLTKKAAEALGLESKTKVIVGTGDEQAACIGAGLLCEEALCDITGTAEPVICFSDRPVFDSEKKLVEVHFSAFNNLWQIENPGFVSGGSTKWFAEKLLHSSDYSLMNELAGSAPIGSNGVCFLPCMSGAMSPTWNESARGTFTGLTLSNGREDLSRSVFEGICFAVRDNADRLSEMGLEYSSVRIVGGGACSPLWCQMKADVLNRPVVSLPSAYCSAAGTAILASVAEGNFKNAREASGQISVSGEKYEPDHAHAKEYDSAYQRYLDCYYSLERFFADHY